MVINIAKSKSAFFPSSRKNQYFAIVYQTQRWKTYLVFHSENVLYKSGVTEELLRGVYSLNVELIYWKGKKMTLTHVSINITAIARLKTH